MPDKSPFASLTADQTDSILDNVDAAVDRDMKQALAAGMPLAGLFVADYISRASCRVLNLAKAMGVPPADIYRAMIGQGLVAVALDILTTFADPSPDAYAKFAEAITQDFIASFAKGAAESAKSNFTVQ